MVDVTMRPVDQSLLDGVLGLRISHEQEDLVASVQKSLAQVAADPALRAFAVFDASQRGLERPTEAPVGFAVIEVRGGVGFILRVMVDQAQQGRGYGRALLRELVRRLRLDPDVERVTTSHRRQNGAMETLCRSLGFETWVTPWVDEDDDEVFLALPG